MDKHMTEIETGYWSWVFQDIDDRVELRVNADSRDEAKQALDEWIEGFRRLAAAPDPFERLAQSKRAWLDSTPPQVIPNWDQSLHDSGHKIGCRCQQRHFSEFVKRCLNQSGLPHEIRPIRVRGK